MPHFMIVLTQYINLLNLSWIKKKKKKKKMSIFEEYGAFKNILTPSSSGGAVTSAVTRVINTPEKYVKCTC